MHLAGRTSRAVLTMIALVAVSGPPSSGHAASVTLAPDRDATIFEEQTFTVLTNGAGAYLFAGRTRVGDNRRALLAFPIAATIPPGATITGAACGDDDGDRDGDVDVADLEFIVERLFPPRPQA